MAAPRVRTRARAFSLQEREKSLSRGPYSSSSCVSGNLSKDSGALRIKEAHARTRERAQSGLWPFSEFFNALFSGLNDVFL